MEELSTIFNNVGLLVAALAGGLSLVMFGFAGIQYMTAQGDPQECPRQRCRSLVPWSVWPSPALRSSCPGSSVVSSLSRPGARTSPGIRSETTCDQLLRNQLVFQRGASTAGRMNEVIRQIQAQRDNCVSELWSPQAVDSTAGTLASCSGTTMLVPGSNPPVCDGTPPGTYTVAVGASHESCASAVVGEQTVPRGLVPDGSAQPRVESGRDSSNNIIIYFGAGNLPSDSAQCWMYVSRLNNWSEGTVGSNRLSLDHGAGSPRAPNQDEKYLRRFTEPEYAGP